MKLTAYIYVFVCVFVYLTVGQITPKAVDGFGLNIQKISTMIQIN